MINFSFPSDGPLKRRREGEEQDQQERPTKKSKWDPNYDYNNNANVELGDLNLVLFNWNFAGSLLPDDWINQRPAAGTTVGLAELNGVLFNWGNSASVATVPEPTAAVLAILRLLALGICPLSR